ncbi:ABC transporter permease [Nocardioides sp. GXZ039]|uniref:ABC transporter permease n=1 Tax=Nocardioides sp. GXZ039 TaxID=3136018 RepID=UPI0030F47AD7
MSTSSEQSQVTDGSPASAPAKGPRVGAGAARGASAQVLIERYALVGLLVLLFAVSALFLEGFRSVAVIQAMVNSQAIVLLLALAATVVLRTGDFDLSIASVMVASAATVAVLSEKGAGPAVAILAALAMGVLVGMVNALLVVGVGVDSFITTLGMFTAFTGAAYAITDSRVVVGVPDLFVELSRAKLLGLPMTTWYAWILVAVLWYVYERTPLGRYLLFIGGNRDSARLAGINVGRIRTGAFVVSGLMASVIGILLVGNLGAIDPSIGNQYLLSPFAAVFLGATTITVGRFNALGTMVALYLLVVGITALQLMGAQSWVNNVFNGVALMLAVALARLAGRRSGERS